MWATCSELLVLSEVVLQASVLDADDDTTDHTNDGEHNEDGGDDDEDDRVL